MRERGIKFEIFQSFTEVWKTIDGLCVDLFGRSIIQEIEVDYSLAQEKYSSLDGYIVPALYQAAMDLQKVRANLIEVLKTKPENILHTSLFQEKLLPKLQPKLIFCSPSGRYPFDSKSPNVQRVFGYRHDVKKELDGLTKWNWAVVYYRESDKDEISLENEYWLTFISEIAPITKLVINGRKHKAMLGPELVHAEARLRTQLEVPLVLDKMFTQDEIKINSAIYGYLTRKKSVRCDITNNELELDDVDIFTKWVYLNDEKLGEALIQYWTRVFRGEHLALLHFWKEWSPWIIVKSLSPLNPEIDFATVLSKLPEKRGVVDRLKRWWDERTG